MGKGSKGLRRQDEMRRKMEQAKEARAQSEKEAVLQSSMRSGGGGGGGAGADSMASRLEALEAEKAAAVAAEDFLRANTIKEQIEALLGGGAAQSPAPATMDDADFKDDFDSKVLKLRDVDSFPRFLMLSPRSPYFYLHPSTPTPQPFPTLPPNFASRGLILTHETFFTITRDPELKCHSINLIPTHETYLPTTCH